MGIASPGLRADLSTRQTQNALTKSSFCALGRVPLPRLKRQSSVSTGAAELIAMIEMLAKGWWRCARHLGQIAMSAPAS